MACDEDGDGDGPAEGAEKGACFPNETCDAGLTCLSNICVNENGAGGSANPGVGGGANHSGGTGSGAGGGFDAATCDECGATECPTETATCEATTGCTELRDCLFSCAEGGSCDCATEEASIEAVEALADWSDCVEDPCADACSGSEASGSGGGQNGSGGNPGTGESCTTMDETRGSCVDSSLEVCDGSEWLVHDCAGCGIVAPTSECAQIFVKTFEEGTGDDINSVDGDVRDVVETGDLVGAEWYLESGQMGVIQFEAASPIDASRVKLEGTTTSVGFITLEKDDGTSGCQYELSGGSLSRYYIVGELGDIDWAGCWGDYEDYDIYTDPTTATVLSIRTTVATTNEIEILGLTQILL